MKKLNFELIRKIDLVLVLVASVVVIVFFIGMIATLIFDRFNHSSPVVTEMPIVESEEQEIKQYVDFEDKIDDVFVFSVKSSGIRADEMSLQSEFAKMGSSFSNTVGKYGNGDGIVNMLFVKGDGNETRLFDTNVFIYKYRLKNDDEYASLSCNVYAVVKKDSDNDKTLSSRDNIALYVSEYDGSALEELSESIVSYRWVGKNQFLYTEFDGKNLSYFAYDTVKKQKILVKTVEQEVDEKQIYM